MKKPKKNFLLSDVYSLTPYTTFCAAVNKEIAKNPLKSLISEDSSISWFTAVTQIHFKKNRH